MTSPITAIEAKKLAEANNSTLKKIYEEVNKKANNGEFELKTEVSKEDYWLIVNILKVNGYTVGMNGDPKYTDSELTIEWH